MNSSPIKQASNLNNEQSQKPQVLLLHGLGRSSRSMRKLANALSSSGYQTFNFDYKGITGSYHSILNQLTKQVNNSIDPCRPLHFVGHSFGGILIRGLLEQKQGWTLGR